MKKISIYTMKNCPFCEAAKKMLTERGVSFDAVLVDDSDDKAWDDLFKKSGMRTMPQIFFGDDIIGGFAELSSIDKEDKLVRFKSRA